MDYKDKFPWTKGGYKYFLVIIDILSGWVEIFSTKRNTATVTVKNLFKEIMCRYGTPADRGSENKGTFVNEGTQAWMSDRGIKQRLHISYHPQSSRMVERMNQIIKNSLTKIVGQYPKQWAGKIPFILAALRNGDRLSSGLKLYHITFAQPIPWWPLELLKRDQCEKVKTL